MKAKRSADIKKTVKNPKKAESIKLCLHQLEEEARDYGYNFSAYLIRAAALSFTAAENE